MKHKKVREMKAKELLKQIRVLSYKFIEQSVHMKFKNNEDFLIQKLEFVRNNLKGVSL